MGLVHRTITTPQIIFENLTAAVRLGEQMLNESSTVDEFNEKLRNSMCLPADTSEAGFIPQIRRETNENN